MFFRGWLDGGTLMSFSPQVRALTTIILPAMKSSGMHKRAVSPSRRWRKLQVFCAEAIIRDFSTQMVLGSPVDPLVFTSMVGDVEFQSFMKSSKFISP